MLNVSFTAKEIDELYEEQSANPSPRMRRKLLAVYLKSQRLEHGRICKMLRVSLPTFLSYMKEYLEGGIGRLTLNMHEGRPSELNAHADMIRREFESKPPATLKEARKRIRSLTGLERSIPQIWEFLHKIGMSSRKVGGIPGKVDVEAQEVFKKKSLNRGLKRRGKASAPSIS
jgi:transposase